MDSNINTNFSLENVTQDNLEYKVKEFSTNRNYINQHESN